MPTLDMAELDFRLPTRVVFGWGAFSEDDIRGLYLDSL